MTRTNTLRIASWSLVLLAFGSGCSMFSRPATDQAQFLLAVPAPAVVSGAKPSAWSIEVRRVTATAPFDGLGFVYAQADGSWRTDSYAGWIASPSTMLSSSLVAFLSNSKQFSLVSGQGATVATDAGITIVIERFCADYTKTDAARAVVQLRWYLTSGDASKDAVVESGVAVGEAPIRAATPGAVADGFGAAVAVAFGEILAGIAGSSGAVSH